MKKKTNKRIMLLCAVLLSVCFSKNVWAVEKIDMNKTGSIEVSMSIDGEAVTGGSLIIYKVADVNSSEVEYGFTYTDVWAECPEKLMDLQSSELSEKLYQYAVKQGFLGLIKEVKEGFIAFEELEVGLYLVAQEESAKGYQKIHPFLISVPMQQGNAWEYQVDASPKIALEKDTVPEEPEKPSDEKIPQTGQLNWPIPWMAVAGLALFGAGWSLCFASKGKTDEK